jgi:uncharacterized protein (TIGR03435 family)
MCHALLLAVATVCLASAQAPLAFEAASVKRANPDANKNSYTRYGEFMGSLEFLIEAAYGVEAYRILGGPSWLDGDKFSVVYKPVGPTANQMLRTLLADRFQLVVHNETKQALVYVMSVAKNGSRMEKVEQAVGTSSGSGMVRGTMDMHALASTLSTILGRRVVDDTHLEGIYKFSLKWTPDERPAVAGDAPSLPTAMQEQLGLKLESSRGPVEVLVIDRAEKPTEN